jgi:hypothetical protein
MRDNGFVVVAKYRKKYYVFSNLNYDTQFNVDAIHKIILSGIYIFITERGRALCYAHDLQKIIKSKHGVLELDID